MLDAITYNEMLENLKEQPSDEGVVGILFTHPKSRLAKDCLERLTLLHHRSGEYLNIYWPGYCAYSNGTYMDEVDVAKINFTTWSFSSKMFSDFIDDTENNSKWKYKGETELLILPYKNYELDFSEVMVLWLDKMLENKAISSADFLFEKIFRYFKTTYPYPRKVSKLSDHEVLTSIGTGVIEYLKKNIFRDFSNTFEKSKFFCIKNLK